MSPPLRRVLLALSLFLVLFPLAVGRPGMPPTLKADEPAYYLMALSLARDGDLRCDAGDVPRLFHGYPYLPVENLILMSGDGWETVYFGKPYIYSLFAAPAAALAGANGMVSFNMLMLMVMVIMGAVYLSRYNHPALAALFSALFFLLSSGFAYVFWLQPEIFNMFAVTACLFFAFHRPRQEPAARPRGRWRTIFGFGWAPVWSAAALALGVYNKPVLAAVGLPALWIFWRRRGWRGVAAWLAAAAVATSLIAGLSTSLTGQPSAYLGVARGGVKVEDTDAFDDLIEPIRHHTARREKAANSWHWIFRIPDVDVAELAENGGYFLWGRHTGLILYMPFALVCLALFLLNRPRDAARWLTLAALAIAALFFLVFIPFNWHGGGGFIGNRYFVNLYPAFLFLVTAVHPAWSVFVGAAAGALTLGPLLMTPYGAPVPKPTLQAHVRGLPFRFFPLELSIRKQVPGYELTGARGLLFIGRKDVFKPHNRARSSMWLHGATRVELWVISEEPLESLVFQVFSLAPDNEVILEMSGDEQRVVFADAQKAVDKRQVVELRPGGPRRMRRERNRDHHVYKLWVTTRNGRHPRNREGVVSWPAFYLGTELTYAGTREQLESPEHYRVGWLGAELPDEVTVGAPFEIAARLRNDTEHPWSPRDPVPVRLSYHWLDSRHQPVAYEGIRSDLPEVAQPGVELEVTLKARPPAEPGSYILVLDLLREDFAWFSRLGGGTLELPVTVVAAESEPSTEGSPEP